MCKDATGNGLVCPGDHTGPALVFRILKCSVICTVGFESKERCTHTTDANDGDECCYEGDDIDPGFEEGNVECAGNGKVERDKGKEFDNFEAAFKGVDGHCCP